MVEGEIRAKETSKNERGEIDFPAARTVTPLSNLDFLQIP